MHTLRCFARVGLEGPAGDTVRLRSRKHLALLVYLAANPDREHPRDRLASLLWETERSQARHSLSQALYDIRANLPSARFDTTVNHVALAGASIDSDAARFEAAVRTGDARGAVSLYRGPFVPDLEAVGTPGFERWVEDERSRLQRLAELAFCRYVSDCDDRAHWGEMCTVALRLLEMNPLNEEAHRAFIRGMWLQGDQHGALEHFRRIEARLKDELPTGLSQETVRLVERVRSSRSEIRPAEPGKPEPARLVGRRDEFATLKEALARLEEGEGGVVVLRGEAGIGKTRLVEEVRKLARLRGVRILESRCFAAESDVSYGPVVEGLAPVAGEPPRGNGDRPTYYQLGVLFPEHFPDPGEERRGELEADAGRRRLFEETAMLLGRACDRAPRLWIVEDLHWIDASSAALLHYVSRRLTDRPLLLLVSVRDEEDLEEAAAALLDDWWGEGRVTRLELDGLSDEDIRELVEETRPDALPEAITSTIQRLAGGNPFFALEMVSAARDLEEWRPSQMSSRELLTQSLRSLFGIRLKGLDLDAVRLLETIAILERHARPFLVARTTNMSSGRVAEIGRTLYSRGLLHDQEGRLEFPHDLTREYVYSSMGELQRAALHLVAGEVLAGSDESVSPSTLARHFALGGDRPRAYEYALRAAEQSAHAYAHDEAIDLSSLALSQSSNARERAAALKILAGAESAKGNPAAAANHLQELIGLDVVDAEEELAVKTRIARARFDLSELRSTYRYLEDLEPSLSALPSGVRLDSEAEIRHWQLRAAMRLQDPALTRIQVQRLKTLLDKLPEDRTAARALALYSLAGYALFSTSADDALESVSRALALLNDDDWDLRIRLNLLKGAALIRKARWAETEATLFECLQLVEPRNDLCLQIGAMTNLVCCKLEQGDWHAVGHWYERSLALTSSMSARLYDRAAIELNMADAIFYQGRVRAALERYEMIRELPQAAEDRALVTDMEISLALCHAQLGDPESALAHFEVVKDLGQTDLASAQDRFKLHWLCSYVGALRGDPGSHEEVVAKLRLEEESDLVSYLKVQWLEYMFAIGKTGGTLDGPAPSSTNVGKRLEANGLSWFAYSARRWMKQAL